MKNVVLEDFFDKKLKLAEILSQGVDRKFDIYFDKNDKAYKILKFQKKLDIFKELFSTMVISEFLRKKEKLGVVYVEKLRVNPEFAKKLREYDKKLIQTVLGEFLDEKTINEELDIAYNTFGIPVSNEVPMPNMVGIL